MHEAQYYIKENNSKVKCTLCPHECVVLQGERGLCKVRQNNNGGLYSLVYNKIAAQQVDPIEKKPLYHFYPGKNILSIGEMGCNFDCSFCQNSSISQCSPEQYLSVQNITPSQIARHASTIHNNIGVAYTYNEPFTFYEFLYDCAKEIHKSGLKNIVVSNGYINPEPLKKLLPFIDAFNIDLKAFNNEFYKKYVKGRLSPVLENLKTIAQSNTHLEITHLVITGINDDEAEFESMVKWISDELGKNMPLHISRYFPVYKLNNPATPIATLEKLYSIAGSYLNYVYLGNVNDEKRSSTYCPGCSTLIVRRSGYLVRKIIAGYVCEDCGEHVNIHQ